MKKMFDHKEQRFSIRKYSCGAASVLDWVCPLYGWSSSIG